MDANPYQSPQEPVHADADPGLARRRLGRILLVGLGTGFGGLALVTFFLFPILGMVFAVLSFLCFRAVKRINPDPELPAEY